MPLDSSARAEVESLIRSALRDVAKVEQLRACERRLEHEIDRRVRDTSDDMWMLLMLFSATGFLLFILAITSSGR